MAIHVHVLGTAQDGGFPHAGCGCANCRHARDNPLLRRRVASIGIVGETGRTLLVDATPDIGDQMAELGAAAGHDGPRLDALVLTHAHVGHYVGLAMLGREAMSVRDLPVHCTKRMRGFLEANRPWAHLVRRGEIGLEALDPGASLEFDGAEIRAFLAPHRSEDTDTIGLEIRGPRRSLVYVSDADTLPEGLVERIGGADVALVDGTFFDRDELAHREILEVRHPFVTESVKLLAGAGGDVRFTHLNHTNALLSEDPPTLPAPFAVAREGDAFAL